MGIARFLAVLVLAVAPLVLVGALTIAIAHQPSARRGSFRTSTYPMASKHRRD